MNEELLQQQEQLKKQGLIKQEAEDTSKIIQINNIHKPHFRNEVNDEDE